MWELRPDRRRQFGAAIADARAGRPRVVCLDGESGMGKTAHLRRIVEAATGFHVVEAFGDPAAYRPPFGVLQRLGVERTTSDDGRPHIPAVAAQALRRLIDDQSRDDPLLLAIDDAQWADAETIDALRLMLERISGDRLLVVIASRPLGAGGHGGWQRFRRDSDAVITVALDGVDLSEADAIVRAQHPDADIRFTERLWHHTDRNPLHLRSLLAQYDLDELRGATDLPAPIEMARELDERLSTMDADAAALLRAIAVVGSSWVDRLDAAAIAGIDDATGAVDLLLGENLLVARGDGSLADVRIVHALVRAAVYRSIPADERRIRHRRAAQLLMSPMVRLEHEVAAADRHDEPLARRLEQAAATARTAADHRREAQLLVWAAKLSETVADTERRWLDAQLATVLARDVAAVRDRVGEIAWVGDRPRRTVVLARLMIAENRIAEARTLLTGVTDDDLAGADAVTRTRLRVLTAWTLLVSGRPTDEIKAVLDEVSPDEAREATVGSFYLLTSGQIAGRELDFDHLARDLSAVPHAVRDTPMADTARLGWRGAVYAMCGFTTDGRRDLAEVVARIRDGRVDAASGVDHALYGFALWQDGELDRASAALEAATAPALDRLHPLVQAILPLPAIVRGDAERADALLAESEAVLRDLPWREAIAVLMQAQIARLHAGGTAAARAAYLGRIRALFGPEATSPSRGDGAIWQMHVAIASVWAGELDAVEAHLVALETDMIVPGWARWARPWLTGLVAEGAGDAGLAHRRLREAVALFDDGLPLYRAHAQADLARVARRSGDTAGADRATAAARTLYARIGAAPYLTEATATDAEAPTDVLAALSDREREVAALLVTGFSYAQIAEELYVTRSTVGFHLGNIYAKTGVTTRHALTQLVHGSHR